MVGSEQPYEGVDVLIREGQDGLAEARVDRLEAEGKRGVPSDSKWSGFAKRLLPADVCVEAYPLVLSSSSDGNQNGGKHDLLETNALLIKPTSESTQRNRSPSSAATEVSRVVTINRSVLMLYHCTLGRRTRNA